MYAFVQYTPPKINISPENQCNAWNLEDDSLPFELVPFWQIYQPVAMMKPSEIFRPACESRNCRILSIVDAQSF